MHFGTNMHFETVSAAMPTAIAAHPPTWGQQPVPFPNPVECPHRTCRLGRQQAVLLRQVVREGEGAAELGGPRAHGRREVAGDDLLEAPRGADVVHPVHHLGCGGKQRMSKSMASMIVFLGCGGLEMSSTQSTTWVGLRNRTVSQQRQTLYQILYYLQTALDGEDLSPTQSTTCPPPGAGQGGAGRGVRVQREG